MRTAPARRAWPTPPATMMHGPDCTCPLCHDAMEADFALDTVLFDDEGTWAGEFAPSHCVTHGYPIVLHCFPAHITDLEPFQRDELDTVAMQIRNGDISGKRIREVRIVGHAATWRGLSADDYRDRALTRAGNARDYIAARIAGYGLSYKPTFVIEGRADSEPLVDNMVHSYSSQARRNRAINRRVEIFLNQAGADPKPIKPGRDPATDWDAFLNTKLRKLEEYWETHRPFDDDRVHACIRRKLLNPRVRDTVVKPIPPVGAYREPASGPYIPEVSLRKLLIEDLKKGYARGPIKKFDQRFDIHIGNVIQGIGNLGYRVTGTDIYNRKMTSAMRSVTRRSNQPLHIYSCPFFKDMIKRINA